MCFKVLNVVIVLFLFYSKLESVNLSAAQVRSLGNGSKFKQSVHLRRHLKNIDLASQS